MHGFPCKNCTFGHKLYTKKSGISKSQLSDIILGNKIPNVYTLHLICTALGISLSDFFDFENTAIKLRGKEALLAKSTESSRQCRRIR